MEFLAQIVAKRLCRWQEHTTVAHGIALYEVEIAIGIRLVVIIQTVAAQEFQKRCVPDAFIGDIGEIDTCRVALELNVESELALLHLRRQIIHVLHHQLPVALSRGVRSVLQRLHKESALGIGQIGSKLTDLIGYAT